MWRISLQQLWGQKRRLVGTGLAVILGIAFLSGTLVLGDTLRQGFNDLFTSVNEDVDAVVRGETRIMSELGSQAGTIDASLLSVVRGVEGVAAAEPEVEGVAQLIGADGEPLGGEGPPTIGINVIDDPRLSSYDLVEGRIPSASGEVAIDKSSSESANLAIGDTTVVRTPAPVRVAIVGLIELPGGASGGGVTLTLFTLADAHRYLLGSEDRVTRILVAGEGISEEELVDRIRPLLPEGTEVITGTALTEELLDQIGSDFLNFFEAMLVVFAAIALLVASFSIYNTFSITVAQRTRQSALLRTVGASRRQVMASILLEAVVIGAFASVIGLAAGIGLATGLKRVMEGFGMPITSGIPAVDGATVVVSFVVGIAVTCVSGLVPAVRASRVPPLAALREVSLDRSDASRRRAIAGASVTAAGIVLVILAGLGVGPVFLLVGLGGFATLVGVVVLGPVVARPVGQVLGEPIARLRGITGELAQQNAIRNPRRTAATASALMIGIAVVTLFTVVAASMKSTIDTEIRRSLGGELVLSAGGFSGSGLSPALADELDRLEEVEAAVGIGIGAALIDGEERVFAVAAPDRLARVLDLDITEGSIDQIGTNGIAITEDVAEAEGLRIGSTLPVTFVDGESAELTVGAIYSGRPGNSVGAYVMPPAVWDPHAIQRSDIRVIVQLADGVSLADGRGAVEDVAAGFGSPSVQDQGEYAQDIAGELDRLLGLIYVLLALAIVIALMGIANALSLSIHERIHEIGLLRAVGQTRRQLRSMVRWESVLVALFGTVGGLGLGTFLGWASIRAVSAEEGIGIFAAPLGQLTLVLAVGALVGFVAAVRPARRAGRIDVLRAIAAE